jgi:phage protein D
MIDAEEDRLYGPDKPGKEIPPEYATREKRINEFRKYQKQLAQEKLKLVEEHQVRIDERKKQEAETGAKKRGRKPRSIEKVEKDAQKKLDLRDIVKSCGLSIRTPQ